MTIFNAFIAGGMVIIAINHMGEGKFWRAAGSFVCGCILLTFSILDSMK